MEPRFCQVRDNRPKFHIFLAETGRYASQAALPAPQAPTRPYGELLLATDAALAPGVPGAPVPPGTTGGLAAPAGGSDITRR